jgi:hypothetical protein
MLTLKSPVTIISILHVNARSITESWLTLRVSDNDMIIPGYKPPFRRDMVGRKGEGF